MSRRSSLFATTILGLLVTLGLLLAIGGGVYAAYANSEANRRAQDLADIGVTLGLAAVVFGITILAISACGVIILRRRRRRFKH